MPAPCWYKHCAAPANALMKPSRSRLAGCTQNQKPEPRKFCAKSTGKSHMSICAWRVCTTPRLWCPRWPGKWHVFTSEIFKATFTQAARWTGKPCTA